MSWQVAERKHYREAITNAQKAAVIEDYIANGLSLTLIAVEHNLAYNTVTTTITEYFKKPLENLTLKSKV